MTNKNAQEPPRFYSLTEVARIMDIDPRTVRRLLRDGNFPHAYKLDPDTRNSKYRIPVTDVEDCQRHLQKRTAA